MKVEEVERWDWRIVFMVLAGCIIVWAVERETAPQIIAKGGLESVDCVASGERSERVLELQGSESEFEIKEGRSSSFLFDLILGQLRSPLFRLTFKKNQRPSISNRRRQRKVLLQFTLRVLLPPTRRERRY